MAKETEDSNIADTICRYVHHYLHDVGRARLSSAAAVGDVGEFELVASILTLELTRQYHVTPKTLPEHLLSSAYFVRRLVARADPADSQSHVFIVYRRGEALATVGRLRDALERTFGTGSVFLDVEDMPFGQRYRSAAMSAISQCSAVLVVVTEQWSVGHPASSIPRLQDIDDPVRIEIEAALLSKVPVVPVVLGGATWPLNTALPSSLLPLLSCEAIAFDHLNDGDDDVEQVIDRCFALDRSRGGTLRLLTLPEMDIDTRRQVRPLVFACQYVARLWMTFINGNQALLDAYEAADKKIVSACEAIIGEWRSFLGLDEARSGPHTRDGVRGVQPITLFELLRQVITLTHSREWNDPSRPRDSELANVTPAQGAGMAAAQLMKKHFVLNARAQALPRRRSSVAQATSMLRAAGRRRRFGHIVLLAVGESDGAYAIRLRAAVSRAFGSRCHTVYAEDTLFDVSIEQLVGVPVEEVSACVVLIDSPEPAPSGYQGELLAELANGAVPILPVLTPNARFPDMRRASAAVRVIFQHAAMELRPDPQFAHDTRRLVRVCREWTGFAEGFGAVNVPDDLPLEVVLPIATLINFVDMLSNNAVAASRGHWGDGALPADVHERVELGKIVLAAWSDYFGFQLELKRKPTLPRREKRRPVDS
jgi:hypothetical protein